MPVRPVPPTQKTVPFGSSRAGPISLMLTVELVTGSLRLTSGRVVCVLPEKTQRSVSGTYLSVRGPPLIWTVRTLPSGSSTQVSSSVFPCFDVDVSVPKPSPASVQESVSGSQMAVRLELTSPSSTRPSARMQLSASLLMKLKEVGLSMVDQAPRPPSASGSKISPFAVPLPTSPASEYSPPIANTRPSLRMPEAKNWRVLAMLMAFDQAPVSYRPWASGVRRYQSLPLALWTRTVPSVSRNMVSGMRPDGRLLKAVHLFAIWLLPG